MRHAVLAIPLALASCRALSPPPPDAPAGPLRPTLEEIFLEPSIHGAPPRVEAVSPGGRWVLFRWKAAGGDGWRVASLLGGSDPGRGTPVAELLPEEPETGVADAVWLPGGSAHGGPRLAVARGSVVWLVDPERRRADELAHLPGPDDAAPGPIEDLAIVRARPALRLLGEEDAFEVPLPPGSGDAVLLTEAIDVPAADLTWSDDGRVALPVPDERAPGEARLWRLGEDRVVSLEGLSAMEEVRDLALSPDGRLVCGLEVDLSGAPPPTLVPDYLGERVATTEGRRLLADGEPPPSRVWIWDATTGAGQEVDLPGLEHGWVSLAGWAPQPDPSSPARLRIVHSAPDWRRREHLVWSEGQLRSAVVEVHPRWVGGPGPAARWSPDGQTLYLISENLASTTTPDQAQLFAVDLLTGESRQLTRVSGEVSGLRVSPTGDVAVVASEDDPAQRRAGRLGGGDDTPRWLDLPPGWVGLPHVDERGNSAVATRAGLLRPAELWVQREGRARLLTDTAPAALGEIDLIRPVALAVEASDGATVWSHVYLPRATSLEAPDAPRAAIAFVHGAGYLQNVTDSMTRYPREALFNARLAAMGYVVFVVDYRGSAGYGSAFRTDVQYHLGGRDLDDIHDVLDHLAARGVVDGGRVGLYGGSYGGFLTLMALSTASERWACGAALRSVTDWRTYSPRYTQPRLGRPSTHPEAYERSSPIDLQAGIEDPVLVLHGLRDSNVFAQDSIRLIEALIDRGASLDAMLYPSQGHAFEDGAHWLDEYRRVERHLTTHLGPPLER